MEVLSKHRGGLNAIARALLDNEIIDGAEVARLVDEAHGSPVHGEGAKSVPHFNEAAIHPPVSNGAGNGHGPHTDADVDAVVDGAGSAIAGTESVTGPEPVAVPAPPSAGLPDTGSTWPPPPWPPPADPERPPSR